jgi:hypothetical protein
MAPPSFALVGLSTVGYIALELLCKTNGAQSVPVKIVLDLSENQDHLLYVGMSVEPEAWVR